MSTHRSEYETAFEEWARLSDASVPAADPRSAQSQIAEAARVDPGSAEVSYRRGCLALERDRKDEAMAQFDAALAVAPDEPRYIYGALVALSGQDSRWVAAKRRVWAERLAATARSADELAMIAEVESAGLAHEGGTPGCAIW